MELLDQQHEEVLTVLADNPNGIAHTQLLNACQTFEDSLTLSRCLHHHLKAGHCEKRDNHYFLKDGVTIEQAMATLVLQTTFKTNNGTAPKPNYKRIIQGREIDTGDVEVIKKAYKRTSFPDLDFKTTALLEAAKLSSPLTRAPLRATRVSGAAAFALFIYQHEKTLLTLEALSRITDLTVVQLKPALDRLVVDSVIQQYGTAEFTLAYRWSGKYSYPFQQIRDDDELLIKLYPEQFKHSNDMKQRTTLSGETITTVDNPMIRKVTLLSKQHRKPRPSVRYPSKYYSNLNSENGIGGT